MKLIIADGSAVVRAIIEQNLRKYAEIEIIASVSNGKKVILSAQNERPDALICGFDIHDPAGRESLHIITDELRLPVVLLSDSKISGVQYQGIVETLEKPRLNSYTKEFFDVLVKELGKISASSEKRSTCADGNGSFKIVCIGASTGGPSAVSQVLSSLGDHFPLPILYIQHLEIGADKNMAHWFSGVCHNVQIKLAENGEEARAGVVYMAPADKHLVIDYVRPNGNPVLRLSNDDPERFLRPAVNKLFRSAAKFYKNACLAVLLTGMGADGAEGCKEICERGGWTIAEDESTCAVFGMPAAAISLGGAKEVLPRPEISRRILELVGK
ncbi:MAG: hypothetical protein IJP62_14060 [Treponema sp.]|nr:hypothetical protein [Treponema sp.]